MRLTEQEQQEIIRFIEADKPLPDIFGNDTMTIVDVNVGKK
jgi:hypothetical protein